ncbi:MAG: hypothetical protein RLZZ206_1132 [Cyanobacteriota bacterium]|jgi:hypothetical protein
MPLCSQLLAFGAGTPRDAAKAAVVKVHAEGVGQLAGRGAAVFHQHEHLEVVKTQGVGKGLVHGWCVPLAAVADGCSQHGAAAAAGNAEGKDPKG